MAQTDAQAFALRSDRLVAKQVHASQLSQLRAICHRAAADMERWRTTTGSQQVQELLAYWGAWSHRMSLTRETNDRLLLFFRMAGATTYLMADGMTAAAEIVGPLATFNPGSSIGAFPISTAAVPAVAAGDVSAPVSTRHAQSLAVTAAALRELHSQVSSGLRSLARVVSEDIVGDVDGPLGKRRDGSFSDGPSVAGIIQALLGHPGGFSGGNTVSLSGAGGSGSSAPAPTASLPILLPILGVGSKAYPTLTPRFAPKHSNPPHHGAAGAATGGSTEGVSAANLSHGGDAVLPNPTSIVTLCAWYAAASADIAAEGAALAGSLTEVAELCSESYRSFEGLCHAFMIGDRKTSKGRDLWTEELRYRRACRAALCVKHRYLHAMALLFDRYRRLEEVRSEVLADAAEKYGAAISRVFERVSGKAVSESVRTLATHADFCKAVEEDSALQVEALRQSSAESAAAAAQAAAAADAAHAAQQQTAAQLAASSHLRFHVEAAPAVISPLCSPLVVRCGALLRQSGGPLMKTWKTVLGVLTRDGFLHLFSTDTEDLASHADLVSAVFAAAATGGKAAAAAAATPAAAALLLSGGGATEPPGAVSAAVPPLPPPALSPALISLAASLANNVADMEAAAAAGTVAPLTLARRCSTPPGLTIQIGPATALAFLPNVHPHAWEIGGERGSWFSGGRQVLRAGSVEEAAEWVVACTQMQDALAPVVSQAAGGATGPTPGAAAATHAVVAASPQPVSRVPPAAAPPTSTKAAAAPGLPASSSVPPPPPLSLPAVSGTAEAPSATPAAASAATAATSPASNTSAAPGAAASEVAAAPDCASGIADPTPAQAAAGSI